MHKYYIGIGVINFIVITLVVVGFIIGGSPTELKDIGLDASRLTSFSTINSAIQQFYTKNHNLPTSLSDMEIQDSVKLDPKTKQPFEYQIKDQTTYELCTNFSTDSNVIKQKYKDDALSGLSYNYLSEKTHTTGHDCIDYNISDNQTSNLYSDNNRPVVIDQSIGQLVFPLDARFDFAPKDSPNVESGFIKAGYTKLLISSADAKVYEVKNNESEYLVQLYGVIVGTQPSSEFEKACFHQPHQVDECGWNITDLDLVSSNGKSSRRNVVNAKDYAIKADNGNLQLIGNFSNQSDTKNLYDGAIYFYVKKSEFAPKSQVSKFTLTGFKQMTPDIKGNKLEVLITII